ncbi:unnamed protein product [Alopecurus aequalis]
MELASLTRSIEQMEVYPKFKQRNVWESIIIMLCTLATLCLTVLALGFLIVNPDPVFGDMMFSIGPIAQAGLDSSMIPPRFNLTIHARNTYKNKAFCGRDLSFEVAYSGVTIGMGNAVPFCVEPKGNAVLTAVASPGWEVLPDTLRWRMAKDRRRGDLELEVVMLFYRDDDLERLSNWIRCRTTLDAT